MFLFPFVFFAFVFKTPLTVEAESQNLVFLKFSDCGNNYALEGFAFQTELVRSKIECANFCARIQKCVSVNVETTMDTGRFKCKLNSHWPISNCSELVFREKSQFFQKIDVKITGATCTEIQETYPNTPSGVYCIQPDPDQECFEAYCEMDVAGGGWTLVYSYRFTDLASGFGPARMSVWPTWPINGETPKSTVVPLGELEEGAMKFDLWKEIGEEFLFTSTVMNWYYCTPSGGSLTKWVEGNIDCTMVKVQVPQYGCTNKVPTRFVLAYGDPMLFSDSPPSAPVMVAWEGQSDIYYPAHDPCGIDGNRDLATRHDDPRGAIYVR